MSTCNLPAINLFPRFLEVGKATALSVDTKPPNQKVTWTISPPSGVTRRAVSDNGRRARHSTRLAALLSVTTFVLAVVGAAAAFGDQLSITQPVAMAPVDVLTHHNNNARTGLNNSESVLTTFDVRNQFGKLFSYGVEGQVYAQPLYLSNLTVPGTGVRNVVFIATQENFVYAFDADTPTQLWRRSLGTPVPSPPKAESNEDNIGNHLVPDIGITGTPVIDRSSGALYVVAYRQRSNGPRFELHALDVTNGQEKFGGPVDVPTGSFWFDRTRELQRPALLLSNGVVYVAFGSHADFEPWAGYIFGYRATDLRQVAQFATSISSPSGPISGAAIWQSGNGPAADEFGNIYFATGNMNCSPPDKSCESGWGPLSNSVIALRPSPEGLSLIATFTPSNNGCLNCYDLDLGSSAPVLLPNTTRLLIGGKEGWVYTLDRAPGNGLRLLGAVPATGEPNQLRCGRPLQFEKAGEIKCRPDFFPGQTHHIHGSPVFWISPKHGPVAYVWAENSLLQAFRFDGNALVSTPIDQSSFGAAGGMPGGVLSLSSNHSRGRTGVLWVAMPTRLGDPGYYPAINNPLKPQCGGSTDAAECIVRGTLLAFDADNIRNYLWSSNANLGRDNADLFAKYVPPTIANGKVYIATFGSSLEQDEKQLNTGRVNVYGLHPKRTVRSNGYFIQSNFGERGNFELIVPGPSGGLIHAWRDNDHQNTWHHAFTFGTGKAGPASVLQSNYSKSGGPGDLILVTQVGGSLLFYAKTDQPQSLWLGPSTPIAADGISGMPAFIQSRFGAIGNFELVVPRSAGGLMHFWRDNDVEVWHQAPDFATSVGHVSAVSLVQSSFSAGGGIGNLEVVARVGDKLALFWRPDTTDATWQGTENVVYFASGTSGIPSLIQGRFGRHGNFELVTPLASGGLAHYWRDNDDPSLAWHLGSTFGTELGSIASVSLIESNYTAGAGIGNLELVAQAGRRLYYFWKPDLPGSAWQGPRAIEFQ